MSVTISKKQLKKTITSYGEITISILIMAIGIYFFKFPNHFVFGGVTGAAVVFAKILPISASSFTFIVNTLLLIIGFIFLGKSFAIKTTYASTLLSILLVVFEKWYPMEHSFSDQPMLELLFAIALPAISSAMLFHIQASSGGTDVIALLIQKYTSIEDIGIGLFISDLIMILVACFVFDIETALYSFVGLIFKSMLIDQIIARMNLSKSIIIMCDDPHPICDFITNTLGKSATITQGVGAYSSDKKYVVFTTMSRTQAQQLREHIRENDLNAFMSIFKTSEVYGKGFSAM